MYKRQRLTCVADGTALDFLEATDLYGLFSIAMDNAIEKMCIRDRPSTAAGMQATMILNHMRMMGQRTYRATPVSRPLSRQKGHNFWK